MPDCAVRFLLSDHLGSTSVTANESGAGVAELRYEAWGENRYTNGTTPTTYRYTGQREESALGLYFYNARWYDPALGRWAQPDTIVPEPGDPQSLNRYSHVLNNPLKYTDPTGHDVSCPGTDASVCNVPLTAQPLAMVKQLANQFGIPFEFLAAVLDAQMTFDYGRLDRLEDGAIRSALSDFKLAEDNPPVLGGGLDLSAASMIALVAEKLDLSLGLGQMKISRAQAMEAKFSSGGLLSTSDDVLAVLGRLESQSDNIRYVAAYVRYLADLRTEKEGPHLSDLSTSDMQIIYGAYRAGPDAYNSVGGFQAVTQPGQMGRLLAPSALEVYRDHPAAR